MRKDNQCFDCDEGVCHPTEPYDETFVSEKYGEITIPNCTHYKCDKCGEGHVSSEEVDLSRR